jgi:pyruvate dehydrogenase E2 component (dihydrolipoamide acetyltransferase)
MIRFELPSLGADMDEGTLLAWHVQPGDVVRRGQVVAVVDTSKAAVDVEIWHDGVVDALHVQPGETVPVGALLATLRAPGEPVGTGGPGEGGLRRAAAPAGAPVGVAVGAPAGAPAGVPVGVSMGAPVGSPLGSPVERPAGVSIGVPVGVPLGVPAGVPVGVPIDVPVGVPVGVSIGVSIGTAGASTAPAALASRPAVSPSGRRRARELGIDPERLHGTGPHGAVTTADVEAAAAQVASGARAAPAAPPTPGSANAAPAVEPAPPAAAASDRQQAMRRAIAAAMSRSKREIPHYYLSEAIPMAAALGWLQARNAGLPITARVLPAALLLKAVAVALRDAPELNGVFVDGTFRPAGAVHAGVAIALRGGGLVAPAIHDVGDLPLDEVMRRLADLVRRARAGSLRSSEMSDPTITVTQLGDQGVESVFGVIYPPQVALVGFGRIADRPWSQNGWIRSMPVVTASLAADHRASDGHRGALFLAGVRDLLQRPETLGGQTP